MPQKPKLGQNFLVDRNACLRIVEALGDISEKTVVEIGPGKGAITGILAAKARRLIAIELDHELAVNLHLPHVSSKAPWVPHPEPQTKGGEQSQFQVIEQDILTVDLASLRSDDEKLFVVGNLPYYITSDILLHLFRYHDSLARAVVMMQREVADRVAAAPGTRDYGLLSATTQLYARVENLFTLPPEAFSPPPQVHSSVLRLTFAPRFDELGIDDVDGFIAFLRQSFAQKRKTLQNNLRAAGYEPAQIITAAQSAGISPQARAEAIPLEAATKLYRALNGHPRA